MSSNAVSKNARTIVLGVVAAALLGTAIVRSLPVSPSEPSAAGARARGGDVAQVPSALASHDRAALEARYRPILDADPFRERKFTTKKGSGGGSADPGEKRADTQGKSDGPGSLALRLTGIFWEDGGFQAFFEDRSAGKGLLAKKDDKLGDKTIADVGSDSRSLVLSGKKGDRSSLLIGDKVDVSIADVSSRLLATTGSVSSATTSSSTTSSSSSSSTLPTLSEETRNSVLERLKAKRKASMGGALPPEGEKPK